MERRRPVESEFDEFDMLLDEIPSATSGNPRHEHLVHVDRLVPAKDYTASDDKSNISLVSKGFNADCYRSPHSSSNGADVAFYKRVFNCSSDQDHHRAVNGGYNLLNLDGGDRRLLDGNSLVSAFQELSVNNSQGKDAATLSPTVRRTNGRIPGIPLLKQGASTVRNNYISEHESANVPISFLPDVLVDAAHFATDMGNTRRENAERKPFEMLNHTSESVALEMAGPRRQKPPPMFSRHVSGFPAFQLPSDLSVPQLQQPCVYMNQPAMMWVAPDDQNYFRDFQYQPVLTQAPVQGAKMPFNDAFMGSARGQAHQLFETPEPGQLGRSARGLYHNNGPVSRGTEPIRNGICRYYSQGFCWKGDRCTFAHVQRQSSPNGLVYSSHISKGGQQFDRLGKHIFPEKMLTRSHGLNSLRCLKSSSLVDIDLLSQGYSNGVLPNGQSRHTTTSLLNNKRIQLNNQNEFDPFCNNLHINPVRSLTPKYTSLQECIGQIYDMSKDHQGCRFLQDVFIDSTPEEVEIIFAEVIDHMSELMTDPFGNYLVQKLLEKCTEDQRTHIVRAITTEHNELVRIACDMHGTRVVQKIIETLKTPEQFSRIVVALQPGSLTLMKDLNGNHVAQRCLQHLKPEYNSFLYDTAIAHCVEISTDRQGCCVMQKCLSNSNSGQRQHLLSQIISNAIVLSHDQYGNYVVQFALEMFIPWATIAILDQIYGKFYDLSTQRYSSHVAEKCLVCASEDQRARIIQELIRHPKFLDIAQDSNGNYVVQTALATTKGKLHADLMDAIRPHIPLLKSSQFGKNVVTKLGLRK